MEMELFPASQLKSFDVSNDRGEDIGRVVDFMIDATSGRVAYAVVAFGGTLGINDKWFAMPMDALCWSPENRKFVADISRKTLEWAPGIDRKNWPAQYMEGNTGWLTDLYTHYSCKPYWATATPSDAPINLGETFNTGRLAPVSGAYRYAGHSEGNDHSLECAPYELEVQLAKGEALPASACGESAIWRLVRLA